ncbi:MAG: type II toxin-antitoxin system RelE/ParE family toxin [Acidobacteriia bacterium]|nr:type II toxin-antitoxin system RelE/ParE family toxin [Terriglobia bacterium]
MNWRLKIAQRAQKSLGKIPARDQERICAALESMGINPFMGDIARLKGEPNSWRRRVGNYRIFFDVDPVRRVIDIIEITRRTSTTY